MLRPGSIPMIRRPSPIAHALLANALLFFHYYIYKAAMILKLDEYSLPST